MQILGKFCADVRVQNVAWPRDRRSDFRKLGIKRCARLERKKSWKGVSRSAAVARQSRILCRGGSNWPPPVKIGLRPKKKIVMLPSPDQNLKIGSVGRDFFFFFFFFLRTVRELSFPIFFYKFLNGENSGRMQSKRIYKSCKCFFKPLNTNFSKFFAQIWHKKKKKKKKNDPVFSHFTVGRERAT